MSLKTLQKFGGFSIIFGAFLIMAYAISFNLFLPVRDETADFAAWVSNSNWIWICMIAFIGVIFIVFGFTAIYSKIYEKSGWIGFIGYISISLAYILQIASLTWEVFIYPVLVSNESTIHIIRDETLLRSPLVSIFLTTFAVIIALGVLIFSIALLRSSEFYKVGTILFLIGALLYAVGGIFIGVIGVIMFAAGSFILGFNLIKGK
jgi:hypothetical protein